jgi:hypothetical protein
VNKIFPCLLLCLAARAEILITTHTEDIAERGPVLSYGMQLGGDQFRLTPPAGWRANVHSTENSLVFFHERLGTVFTIRINGHPAPKTARELAKIAAEKYPGGRTVEQFTCVARDSQGLAADVEFNAADGSVYASRLGIVAYGAASIELALTGPAGSISQAHSAWTSVLNSLTRHSPAG